VKYLHDKSPEVLELIRALGVDMNDLTKVVITVEVGSIVKMVADYRRVLWASDAATIQNFCKKYEMTIRELPP